MKMNNIMHSFATFLGSNKPQLPTIDKRASATLPHNDGCRDRVLGIDASGSMSSNDWKPTRLKAAKRAATAFVKRLSSEDPDANVAVVAYGDTASLIVELTPARRLREVARAIDSISGMGHTNITAALEMALDVLGTTQGPGQVVLLTDGCHNTGPDPYATADMLRERAIVECVGIGGGPADVDEELLRYIASSYPDGSKRYRWIGDKERLVQHFHNLAGRIVRA